MGRIGKLLAHALAADGMPQPPCSNCGDEHPGQGGIFVVLPFDKLDDGSVRSCRLCGATVDRAGRSVRTRVVIAAAAVRAAGPQPGLE